jgi:hypothetical protein
MPKKKQQVVYVVVYGHKHGNDCWVRSTNDKAMLSVATTIKEYLTDVFDADAQKKIKRLLNEGKIAKAMTLYGEHTEEWFEIYPREVDT